MRGRPDEGAGALSDASTICRSCGRLDEAPEGLLCRCGSVCLAVGAHQRHPADPLLGSVVGGEFVVVDLIGDGGYGTVYRALQIPLLRPVALKVLRPEHTRVDDIRARFHREARVIGSLSGDAVVRLIRYGEQRSRDGSGALLYIALEYVRGRTLRDVITAEAPLGVGRTLRIAGQILAALAEAHALGVVHRDLKPANVMLTVDVFGRERARVLDFGIAGIVEGADIDGVHTRTGMALGTPSYMAPEQIAGADIDGRADLYALGVMLFEMLTGRRLYEAATTRGLLAAHLGAPVPPLDEALGVPAVVAEVVYTATQKAREARYADAGAMYLAVRAAASAWRAAGGERPAGELEPVSSPTRSEGTSRVGGERWRVRSAAALVLGVALGALPWGALLGWPAGVTPPVALSVDAMGAEGEPASGSGVSAAEIVRRGSRGSAGSGVAAGTMGGGVGGAVAGGAVADADAEVASSTAAETSTEAAAKAAAEAAVRIGRAHERRRRPLRAPTAAPTVGAHARPAKLADGHRASTAVHGRDDMHDTHDGIDTSSFGGTPPAPSGGRAAPAALRSPDIVIVPEL